MPFIVDNNFDAALEGMKAAGYAEAYVTNQPAVVSAELNGRKVEAHVMRKRVKGRITLVCCYVLEGKRLGLNALRGQLRRS